MYFRLKIKNCKIKTDERILPKNLKFKKLLPVIGITLVEDYHFVHWTGGPSVHRVLGWGIIVPSEF